jgi:hypothetical protein
MDKLNGRFEDKERHRVFPTGELISVNRIAGIAEARCAQADPEQGK